MKNKLTISLALFLVMSLSFDADAQYKRRKRSKYGYKKTSSKKFSKYSGGKVGYSGVGNPKYQTVGLSINTGTYMGDLTPGSGKFSADYVRSFVPAGLGVTYSKVLYPGIFGRVGFNWVRLHGSDYRDDFNAEDPNELGRFGRNFHFRNDILEISVGLELDLIPSNSGARGRFPINPYIYLGVAGFYNNPKAIAPSEDQADNSTGKGGQWVALQPLQTSDEKYSKFQFAVPIGLGCKFKITRNFDIDLEFGLRYTFTDYIDDVGGNYRNLDEFGNDHLARALSERGAEEAGYLRGKSQDRNDQFGTATWTVGTELSSDDTNWENNTYRTGDNYNHPGDGVEASPRGGGPNDFYVVSQIRLVYILDKKGISKGKFR